MVLVLHPAPQAGHLLRGIGNRKAHALFVEPGERGGRAERGEGRGRSLRAAVRAAHQIRPQRHRQAATEIIAERHRANEFLTAATLLFGDGERGRHHGTARMRLGDRLDIVGLIGMGAHGVGERGVDRRGEEVGTNHRGLRLAAKPPVQEISE